MKNFSTLSRFIGIGALLSGCASSTDAPESRPDGIASTAEALTVSVSPTSVSYDYLDLPKGPAGVAGGIDAVFVGSPLEQRVLAYGRLTGRAIGELPQPPNGFGVPFILHSIAPNKVAVLDAGGLPQPAPFTPSHPTIYEYTYSVGVNGLKATLTRTVSFDAVTIGFPEDFVSLGDGRYLISDAILGALYLAQSDGSVVPLIAPRSFDPQDLLPIFALCPTMPEIHINGLPFLFSGSTLPGISALALRNGTLYFTSPCGGGLFSVPFAGLFDGRTPTARAADARPVSLKPSNVPVEELLGATFNPYAPDEPYLYAADALQLRVIRIDVRTGRREVVADDGKLFDFPSSLAFLPPAIGVSPLAVVSNQQERNPLTNDAITTDVSKPPFIVAKIYTWPGGVGPIAP